METKLSLRKCVWKIDESRLSKISFERVWYEGCRKFSTIFCGRKEEERGEGERRARNNLNPEGRAERGNKVTHGDT